MDTQSRSDRDIGAAGGTNIPLPTIDTDEYNRVRDYVIKRDLVRPRYALPRFLLRLVAVAAVGLAAGYAVHRLSHGAVELRLALSIATGLAVLLQLRWLIIDLVRVYQRYASDDIRRNCVLMPTCSEYCILALKKYGVVRGCWKTVYRLFHTCKGDVYHEDWP